MTKNEIKSIGSRPRGARHWWILALSNLLLSSVTALAETPAQRYELAGGPVSLKLPDPSWTIEEDDQQPPLIASIQDGDETIRARLALQEAPDVTVGYLALPIENTLSTRYQKFSKLSSVIETIAGHDVFRLEFTYEADGVEKYTLSVYTMTGDYLFNILFEAPTAELTRLKPRFDELLASVEIDGRHLVEEAPDKSQGR